MSRNAAHSTSSALDVAACDPQWDKVTFGICLHLGIIFLDTKNLGNDFIPKMLVHQSSAGQLGVETCSACNGSMMSCEGASLHREQI